MSTSSLEDLLWSSSEDGDSTVSLTTSCQVFWELLSNIKKVQVSVSVHPDELVHVVLRDSRHLQISVVSGLTIDQLTAASPARSCLVNVETQVVELSCASVWNSGPVAFQTSFSDDGARKYIEARIDVEISDEIEADLGSRYTGILEHELSTLSSISAVFCGWCGETLASSGEDGSLVRKAMGMPSEYWVELADLWVCHKETFTQFPKKQVEPSMEHCLVAPTALNLHPQHFASTLSSRPNDESLFCTRCSVRVGRRHGENTVQLDKHAISTVLKPFDRSNLFAQYNLVMKYAAQLYSACLAHLTYFFSLTVVDPGTQQPVPLVHLRILSPAHVSLSKHRHLKVLYQRPSVSARDAKSPFQVARTHETICSYFEDAQALLTALRSSSSFLPAARRAIGRWTIGFLPLPFSFRT